MKNYRKSLSIGLSLVFAVLVVRYIASNWDEFSGLSFENPWMLVAIFLASLINMFMMGKGLDVLLRPHGINLAGSETFALASVSRFFNLLVPGRAGFLIRALYLKQKYKFTLAKFVSTITAAHLFMYLVAAGVGLISLSLIDAENELLFGLGFAAILIIILTILIVPFRQFEGKNRLSRLFAKIISGWITIRRDRQTLKQTILWMSLNVFTQILVFYSSFVVLGVNITAYEACFIGATAMFGSVISITPGGFGIIEGLVVIAASTLDVPVTMALAAALVRRMAAVTVAAASTMLTSKKLFDEGLSSVFTKLGQKS